MNYQNNEWTYVEWPTNNLGDEDSQVCTRGKIMMYLFFWIVMEFALVVGAVQLILKKGGF
jgi:hypothetical protein